MNEHFVDIAFSTKDANGMADLDMVLFLLGLHPYCGQIDSSEDRSGLYSCSK